MAKKEKQKAIEVTLWEDANKLRGSVEPYLFKVYSKKYPKWLYYLWTKFHLTEFTKIAEDKATSLSYIKHKHLIGE